MHSNNFTNETNGYAPQRHDSSHQQQDQQQQQQQQQQHQQQQQQQHQQQHQRHPPPPPAQQRQFHGQMIPRPELRAPASQQHRLSRPIHDVAAGLDPRQHSTAAHVSSTYQPADSGPPRYMFGAGSTTNSAEAANKSSSSAIGDSPASRQQFSSPLPPPPPPAHGQFASNFSVYPSTLVPSRNIHSHSYQQSSISHHQLHPPVKLLQSCDSCRRRKIRCSGEKPVCTACMRYQEMCHYSPLATPRRRAGKRARTAKDAEAAANVGQSAIDIASAGSVDRASSGEPLGSSSSMRALSGNSIATVSDVVEPVIPSTQAEPSSSTPEDRHWKPEATEMRRDINMLSQRFNSISSKLDYLIKIVGKRRRGSIGDSDAESGSDEEVTPGYENENRHDSDREAADRSSGGVYHDFNNRADRTSRFNIDATNVGNITGMMENIDRQRGEQQLPGNDVHVSVAMRSPRLTHSEGRGIYGIVSGLNMVERAQAASAVQMLDTPEIQEDLIDKFYLNADVNTISFIPRYIFHRLREEKRTPTAMLNLMMAGACNYSSHEAIIAIGRGVACGIFIERAYKALFDCLEYDSAEHCVSLLLFAMVISNTGLHRAWIMQSLSTQMAIRLRFNTIDSPLSALAFKNDSELIREWKRRVFWQLYSFELLSNTLSDLPPCLSIDDVRCNAPRPLTEELASSHDEQAQAIAALGPAVLFCEDQSTISLQIELMRIMCDISSLQNRMTPEENMFPPKFMQIHAQLAEWKQRLPHLEVLVEGNMERLSTVFKGQPGLIVLGLLCQYVQIYLCLIKDTWLPTTRAMTAEETKTLDWARTTAYETAQVVHRLVPFVQGMRLNTVSPVVSNVVFQACVVSVYSCGWKRDPRRILAAVQNVQSGLGFLDYVSSRWGFSSIMTTSLRSMIVERGFGATGPDGEASPGEMSMDDDDLGGKNPEQAVADEGGLDSSAKSDPNLHEKVSNTTSLPESLMQPFQKEANWERILRTGEIHSLEFEIDSMRGPCTRMCKEDIHASDVRRQDDSTE